MENIALIKFVFQRIISYQLLNTWCQIICIKNIIFFSTKNFDFSKCWILSNFSTTSMQLTLSNLTLKKLITECSWVRLHDYPKFCKKRYILQNWVILQKPNIFKFVPLRPINQATYVAQKSYCLFSLEKIIKCWWIIKPLSLYLFSNIVCIDGMFISATLYYTLERDKVLG